MTLNVAREARRLGFRIVAEDAERFEEEARFDEVFCSRCGVYFAAVTDDVDTRARRWLEHKVEGQHA